MGFFKDKFKKSRETHENGYVSFTQEDLKEGMTTNPINEDAYELLDAAMTTSSNITVVDEANQTVNVDDIYPCSEAECDEMDRLLDQAKAALKDPNDAFFNERYNELRDIVSWSREKHWTFKWVLILGCFLSIFIMFYVAGSATSNRNQIESKVNTIKNWEKQDTTIAMEDLTLDSLVYDIKRANSHKAFTLHGIKRSYENRVDDIARYNAILDTIQNRDDKKFYKDRLKVAEKKADALLEEYEDVNDMKFKAYRKYAVNSLKGELRAARWLDRIIWILFIYVLLLTPVYIYSSHQYGYYITRYRAESAKLDKLQKIGFAFASFLLGAGLAMQFFPETKVTTIYSSGRRETHTESNPLDIAIIVLKLILFAAAACVFSFVCIFIMSYVTITAFKRNHDWSKVSEATKVLTSKAAEVAGKATDVAKKAATKAAAKAAEVVDEQIQKHKSDKEQTPEE